MSGRLQVSLKSFSFGVYVSEYYIHVLTTDADGKIKIWHISTSSCIGTLMEGSKQILACAYNSSGDRFVTAGSDTKLNVYDERTKQVICTLQPRYANV